MKRHLLVFLITALMLGACAPRQTPDDSGFPLLGPTPTPNLGDPDGVANAFLSAWVGGDYDGMYSLLSPTSQTEYTLEAFKETYAGTATAMTLIDVQAAPLSSLRDEGGTTARVAFKVTYNTQVLGPIEEELMMNLLLSDGRWGVSWSPTLIFPELAGGNIMQLDIETPSRANIYDRNGEPLVIQDSQTVTLNIVPMEISVGVEQQMLELLATLLRSTPEDVKSRYEGLPTDWWIALGDADAEMVRSYGAVLNGYPGIHITEKTGRRYFNVLAPHLMGYSGQIPAEQIDDYQSRGYQGDEIVGLTGLEYWGESWLAGTRGGVLSAYTSTGQYFGEIARRDPQPSQSVYSTIDRNLQTIVQDAVEDAYQAGAETWAPRAGGAAVVAIDVKTGDVLAMTSYPSYDPNVLNPNNNHPLFTDTYVTDLFNDPRRPFINRVTQSAYPAGSLFKVIVMAAALDSGLFEDNSLYTCTGLWAEAGENDIREDWKEEGHGDVTLSQGLTASCNTFFYHIGYNTALEDPDLLPRYARDFGLGRDLGMIIDENAGIVPSPDWLMETRGEEWKLADSINLSIGQGDLQVTPMQMAVAVAAIANGGTLYTPQFVEKIGLIGEEPSVVYEPQVLGELSISDEDLQSIRESMRGVIADPVYGTAFYRLSGIEVAAAGKTGTAQVGDATTPPIAWFGGFAPYDDPQIAIVVMVENGGQGSGVAAPIFRRILEAYYNTPIASYPPDWYNAELFNFVDAIGE